MFILFIRKDQNVFDNSCWKSALFCSDLGFEQESNGSEDDTNPYTPIQNNHKVVTKTINFAPNLLKNVTPRVTVDLMSNDCEQELKSQKFEIDDIEAK